MLLPLNEKRWGPFTPPAAFFFELASGSIGEGGVEEERGVDPDAHGAADLGIPSTTPGEDVRDHLGGKRVGAGGAEEGGDLLAGGARGAGGE